ncbi:NADH-quinone oxidoreductase subunit M [Salinibacillus kushneri]|uniref:NADH-quinone oxidoreductase subunit M n=1 Tax=Salinibacillus kushneri TaxID=237682 RepID=A0A1I0CYC2_9BACI|nr:NADH-quinone oxidoreductase subunit M [Salinibacillus kushneri]SET24862.1 NADH-quinone oxidoreductase subunit M [Salinibacillus kushneri]
MGTLSLLVFSPAIGILALLMTRNSDNNQRTHVLALLSSFIPLLLSIFVFALFQGGNQLEERVSWITFQVAERTLTLDYELAVDGFSVLLIILTTVVSLLAILSARWMVNKDLNLFFIFMLFLEIGTLGVFSAHNLILFFVFFEITLIPMFFLIGKWGGTDREEAAFRYIIYNGLGSMLLLLAIAVIFINVGNTNFSVVADFFSGGEQKRFQAGMAIALLLAFGVKLPIFPLHSWMVKVHVHAPPALVMIHAGVLLKIGAYGLIKFGVFFFPEGFEILAPVIAILGLINLLYGAFLAFRQTELRAVLAYSSISHMGLILLGVAALNEAGIQGAIFQAVSHGLISALFFLLVGILLVRTQTTHLKRLSGLARLTPLLAGYFLVAALAGLGLPGMSGFVSEFTVFLGIFKTMPVIGAIGTLGLIMTVVYFLRAILNMTFGSYRNTFGNLKDLRTEEVISATILLLCIIGIGIFPNSVALTIQQTLETILVGIGG